MSESTPPQPAPEATAPAAHPPAHPHHPHLGHRPPLFTVANVLWLLFFLALTGATRCANFRHVFLTSDSGRRQIYFVDGDCYSRMTRVRMILEHHAGIIHFHPWENFPIGTWPHTTLPMDYLIVALALVLKPFCRSYIDLAGAIVSPLLGLAITAFLAVWARELNQQYRKLMLLLVSISPILVHGTALGRPDHQSLQMFLLTVAVCAELILARTPCVSWEFAAGLSWGLSLWVSLYEPLVLIAVVMTAKIAFYRSSFFVRERLWGVGAFLAVLALAALLEGPALFTSFSTELHDSALRDYFHNWSSSIGEMYGVSTFGNLIYRWVGAGLLVAPLLLIARLRDTRRSLLLLILLIVTFIFTLMEARWGYFFALVYAMSLPWQLSLFKWKWVVWTLYLLSLWPVARDWDERLFPDMDHELLREGQLNDQRLLRQAAEFIRDRAPGGILAPWWWSPALVYWSGQPAVAGSSHESLAGIVDSARFFTATDALSAKKICDTRQVETIVLGSPGNILDNSFQILGQPPADNTMADVLWEKPHSAPRFLHIVFDNNYVKVFEVNHGWIVR